jgi:phospholipid-binding lipoprotein MlaA
MTIKPWLSANLCGAVLFVLPLFSPPLFSPSILAAPAFAQDEVPDPWESTNRSIFDFNDTLDVNILEPVARAYDENTPPPLKTGIFNFFRNIRYPRYLVSDLVQLKFTQALEHTGRFVLNTTFGVAGLIDVAKHVGLPDHQEDFGTALGYHGVGTGPYMVLPFLGPSNVRDTVGTVVDFALDPLYFVSFLVTPNPIDTGLSISATTVKYVDRRAGLLEAVEAGKESSLDFYLFTKSAYQQFRQGLIHDGRAPEAGGEFDDEFAEDTAKEEDTAK